jgi:hypothetical protein
MVDDLLPVDPDLELLHTRDYQVRSYRKADDVLLLRGAVRDTKPAGLYVDGDTEPMVIHHMIVDLEVQYPSLEIIGAEVVMETHPHGTCPSITAHYDKLVGLSIARGFTHKVRELFGGPRGCTHTTALLQAMAPVAIQSTWSMRAAPAGEGGVRIPVRRDPEERKKMMLFNLNTCHVWAEDGERIASVNRGDEPEMPLWMVERMAKLGIPLEEMEARWRG